MTCTTERLVERGLGEMQIVYEHQRQVLIGTGHRGREGCVAVSVARPPGKGRRRPFHGGDRNPKGKGKSKSNLPPRQTYVTEFNEPETIHEEPDPDTTEVNDDDGEEDDQPDNEADEEADDGGSWDDDPEVAEILTITALASWLESCKLASMAQVALPCPRSPSQRGRGTHIVPHAAKAGDAGCSASGKGRNKSTTYRDGGKNTGGGKGEKGKAKFVHFTMVATRMMKQSPNMLLMLSWSHS